MCEQGSTPTFSPSSTGAKQIVQSKDSSSSDASSFSSSRVLVSTSLFSLVNACEFLLDTSSSSDSESSSMPSSHEAIVSGVDTISCLIPFFVGVEGWRVSTSSPSSFSSPRHSFALCNRACSLLISSCFALNFLVCRTYSFGRGGVCKIPKDSACAIHRPIASSPPTVGPSFGILIPLVLSKYRPLPSANLANLAVAASILSRCSISLCMILSNRLSFILQLGQIFETT
mmetsp:Transcript_10759/g.15884  ORF Transcript_10759/g.15884 Transcript_10759/m.15884 type:complete len:229 (-) Transcript_10759:710-1396(-)